MYPENPEGTQVIEGSMNMGYIYDTARKCEPVPLGNKMSDNL